MNSTRTVTDWQAPLQTMAAWFCRHGAVKLSSACLGSWLVHPPVPDRAGCTGSPGKALFWRPRLLPADPILEQLPRCGAEAFWWNLRAACARLCKEMCSAVLWRHEGGRCASPPSSTLSCTDPRGVGGWRGQTSRNLKAGADEPAAQQVVLQ